MTIAKRAGTTPDLISVSLPGKSWTELSARTPGMRTIQDRKLQTAWKLPLTTGGTTVTDIAAGKTDTQWANLGKQIATLPKRPIITLVIPANSEPAQAKAAWRRASGALHRAAPNAILVWQAPLGVTPADAAVMYPGDDLVTVVGLSIPTTGTWSQVLDGPGGLTAWSDWAAQHGKRLGVTWASTDKTTPAWKHTVHDWLALSATQKRVAYELTNTASLSRATKLQKD